MRTIRLYGDLGKKYGRVIKLNVESVAEAIRALSANFPSFRQYIIDSKNIAGYEVWDGKKNLDTENVEDFHSFGNRDIKIIPRVQGAGNAAKIIIGVALIAVASIATGGLTAAFTPGAGLWGSVASFGVSLVLSGIVGMMTPTAKGTTMDSDSNNTQSYLFSGIQNTTKQGNPVTIAYGTHLLGSQVVSAALITEDTPI